MSRNGKTNSERAGEAAVYVGADIGGTFTDLVLVNAQGAVMTRKVSSTAADYGEAIVTGLRELFDEQGVDPIRVASVAHGTTVATNTILESKGARTGLITTAGFRDVLEIGRLRMPRLYDPQWAKPPALVERDLRFEIPERVDVMGRLVVELDEEAARRAVRELTALGVESLAICFLHAYVNPTHERRVAAIAAEIAPQLDVSISSEILPEIREYERLSTTVINSYVRPVVRSYLTSLAEKLHDRGIEAPIWVMQSNGGLMSVRAAADRPIHIIESGPAAGVVGALDLARRQEIGNLITFDMGGTTAKVALIEEGQPSVAPDYEVGAGISIGSRLMRGGGYTLRVPAIDIAEIGAGGGSIIWIDSGGSLRIGPHSAGSVPGPVAYSRGGDQPTLTDANILLGYVDSLAGGSLALDATRALEVFRAQIADPLGLSVEAAAFGARQVANSSMVQAVRAVSTERGRDPRDFVLFAFGGNGPVHAAAVATEMGISRVLVPPAPGVFSAFGLCRAKVAQHFVRTHIVELLEPAARSLESLWVSLEDEARDGMRHEGGQALLLRRLADVRYVGQSTELTIPLETARIDGPALGALTRAFAAEHRRTYGHEAPENPVELVSARVVATLADSGPSPASVAVERGVGSRSDSRAGSPGSRRAYFGREHGWCEIPALSDREEFSSRREGPCILDLYDATVVVPPGWTAQLDRDRNLVLDSSLDHRDGH